MRKSSRRLHVGEVRCREKLDGQWSCKKPVVTTFTLLMVISIHCAITGLIFGLTPWRFPGICRINSLNCIPLPQHCNMITDTGRWYIVVYIFLSELTDAYTRSRLLALHPCSQLADDRYTRIYGMWKGLVDPRATLQLEMKPIKSRALYFMEPHWKEIWKITVSTSKLAIQLSPSAAASGRWVILLSRVMWCELTLKKFI